MNLRPNWFVRSVCWTNDAIFQQLQNSVLSVIIPISCFHIYNVFVYMRIDCTLHRNGYRSNLFSIKIVYFIPSNRELNINQWSDYVIKLNICFSVSWTFYSWFKPFGDRNSFQRCAYVTDWLWCQFVWCFAFCSYLVKDLIWWHNQINNVYPFVLNFLMSDWLSLQANNSPRNFWRVRWRVNNINLKKLVFYWESRWTINFFLLVHGGFSLN